MRKFLLSSILAMAVSACGDVVIGPVDHSCVYANKGTGSGCAGGNR